MTDRLYLSLGSNLGDREAVLLEAVKRIDERVGKVLVRSSFYYSKPQGFVSENDVVNLVVRCSTSLSSYEVLWLTQEIERELGRTQKSHDGIHYDRTIDIDILIYGDEEINTKELMIPHPLMKERDFVMIPLREIM
ncbi:MAG: 2-amino-4-hydroxy-6-hydroxymethyldihydropteridine diphosphokinase [Prevotella sp.]|nr:2-amino-4-hydroxy-6-hydroxymethyldihydropteridine diphosphokinase [Prevotella sp.]